MGRDSVAAKARRQAAASAAAGQGAVAEPVAEVKNPIAASPPTERDIRVSGSGRRLQTRNSIETRRDMVESAPTYQNFPLNFSEADRKTYEKIHSEASRLRQQVEDAYYKRTSEKTRTKPDGPRRYDPDYIFDASAIQVRLGSVFRSLQNARQDRYYMEEARNSRQYRYYIKEARRLLDTSRSDIATFLNR